MSFIDFIEKLQNKPRHIRIQILWVSVFVLMSVIVSGWVISLKYSLEDVTAQQQEDTEEIVKSVKQAKQEMPSFMESFKASIGAFFDDKNQTIDSLENSSKSSGDNTDFEINPQPKIKNDNNKKKNPQGNSPAMLPLK